MTNTTQTTKIAASTWRTTDISLADIRAYFRAFPGASGWTEAGMTSGQAASRARGAWACNEREMHAIYRSLECHLRAAELASISAELDAFMEVSAA